jgi:hypothetical protein
MSVILRRLPLVLVVLAVTTLGCGGSSNGGLQALCAKSCQKLVACLPELGTEAQCEAACNSASGTTCPNLAARTNGLNECLAMTCSDFEPCFVAVPHCASTDGGADTAGSSGGGGAAGSPGGSAGTVGTGSAGHTGSAGTGGGRAGSSGNGGTAGGLGMGGAGSGGAASAVSTVDVIDQYVDGVFSTSTVYANFATASGMMASAGTVTVTGATVPISITPTIAGVYRAVGNSPLFATGDTLVLSATGGDVPAFSNVQVVAPAGVVVTAPVEVADVYTIDTTADLPLAWTGGETGVIVVFIFADSSNQVQIDIPFDSTLHAGTVPKGMLSKLASLGGYLIAQTSRSTQIDEGMVTSIDFAVVTNYLGNAVFQ